MYEAHVNGFTAMQNTQQKHVSTFPSKSSNNLSIVDLYSTSYTVTNQDAECLETVTQIERLECAYVCVDARIETAGAGW